MEKLIEKLSQAVSAAFAAAGYDPACGRVTASNRPDLCEFQCNGAMPAARTEHKAPLLIAQDVAAKLHGSEVFASAEAVKPGFLNLCVKPEFLAAHLEQMRAQPRLGVTGGVPARTVVLDYGGPNVAKPLHVGHLRPAIIGESIKRIYRYFGDKVIGDIHLGDWGLQMGLVIAELQERRPDLPYFDENAAEYPEEAPCTVSELEEIYPFASAKSKQDPAFARKAHEITAQLQAHQRGYYALWQRILAISVADLKRNYENLSVSFDVWKGESDAEPYIPPMLDKLAAAGVLTESEGAKVVEVAEPDDKKEMPPCIVVKSDGATLYATTDLATIVQRMEDYHPDKILYVTDKRQNLHFEQVFRAARKGGLVPETTQLQHIGFGTMNGKDGKPFKTRDGGVMRLETLIADITGYVEGKSSKIRLSKRPRRTTPRVSSRLRRSSTAICRILPRRTISLIWNASRPSRAIPGRISSIPSCASSPS